MKKTVKYKFNKDDFSAILYALILIFLFVKTPTGVFWNGIKSISLLGMIFLPFKMVTYFKVMNTYILSILVWASSNTIFLVNEVNQVRFTQGMTYSLFALLLINIVVVIVELYRVDEPVNTNTFLNLFYRIAYRYRFIYIIFSVLILLIVVISGFHNIYQTIYIINRNAFQGNFESLYLSFTTFFTIGYGDITPYSYNARLFVMTQMIVSYIVTAMILPIMIVAIFKLVERKSNDDRQEA